MSELILALAAGGVVGLALGALGGGGGVLAVPALIYLLGFTPVEATTASLLIVTVTSLTALYAHARAGAVRWRSGALFAAAGCSPPRRRRAWRTGCPARCSPRRSPGSRASRPCGCCVRTPRSPPPYGR